MGDRIELAKVAVKCLRLSWAVPSVTLLPCSDPGTIDGVRTDETAVPALGLANGGARYSVRVACGEQGAEVPEL